MSQTTPPPSEDAGDYMILRPEKARLWDIFSLVIFRRRRLNTYRFVDAGIHHSLGTDQPTDDNQWVVALTLLIQKVLLSIKKPLAWAGSVIEYIINLFALNGGLFRLLWRFVTGSLVIPKRDTANFRSLIGHIDGRMELFKTSSLNNCSPAGRLMDLQSTAGDVNALDLSMMASKIAYENPAYIEDVVTNHWKMQFVGFFSCWNKFLNNNTTQAFIFCNKEKDADLIVLAFRGTEAFNAQDWSTDVDLSWLSMGPKMGHAHLGFLKALGLQDETNFFTGFPKSYNGNKTVAYYVLRDELRSLLKQHKNAKILVTGHSLGGALAAIFPALLDFHGQKDILDSMYGVMTYGQPRVGDEIFGIYMEYIVRIQHHRMVYRFDIVPRVPFDLPPLARFKHFGTCIYYNGWYNRQEMVDGDAPNPNYFSGLYMVQMYLYAWLDIFRALFVRFTQGQDYKEGYVSILYRSLGLVVPGIAFHSPRDYVNSGRLSKIITSKSMV